MFLLDWELCRLIIAATHTSVLSEPPLEGISTHLLPQSGIWLMFGVCFCFLVSLPIIQHWLYLVFFYNIITFDFMMNFHFFFLNFFKYWFYFLSVFSCFFTDCHLVCLYFTSSQYVCLFFDPNQIFEAFPYFVAFFPHWKSFWNLHTFSFPPPASCESCVRVLIFILWCIQEENMWNCFIVRSTFGLHLQAQIFEDKQKCKFPLEFYY